MNKIIIGNWKENPESLDIAKKLIDISESFEDERDKEFWDAVENNRPWPKEKIKIAHAVPSIFAEKSLLHSRKSKVISFFYFLALIILF